MSGPCVVASISGLGRAWHHKVLANDGNWRVVVAHDAEGRCFAGASSRSDSCAHFLFVQIDDKTRLELESGSVHLRTVMADRSIGLAFEAKARSVTLIDARTSLFTIGLGG